MFSDDDDYKDLEYEEYQEIYGDRDEDFKEVDRNVLVRLDKDLKEAAKMMNRAEARFLVDLYYQTQKLRIQASNQRFAMSKDEPVNVPTWVKGNLFVVEKDIMAALGNFANEYAVGKWLRSVYGIGPVLSAGFLTTLSIKGAATAGHWQRFAGIDPTLRWVSGAEAKGIVTEALRAKVTAKNVNVGDIVYLDEFDERDSEQIRSLRKTELELGQAMVVSQIIGNSLLVNADDGTMINSDRREMELPMSKFRVDVKWPMKKEVLPHHVQRCADLVGRRPEQIQKAHAFLSRNKMNEAVKETTSVPLTREKLEKAISVRPWNARLKVLCYKAGESFIKTQNRDGDVYGHIYARRKEYEIFKNEKGDYAEQAAEKVKRVGKNTIAYKYYSQGKLSPRHILARCRRYAVKIFLSHLHHVSYMDYYGEKPPVPYVFSKHYKGDEDHRHFIEPPRFDPSKGKPLKQLLDRE